MNSIDFLPEAYHQQRLYRNIRRRRWVLVILTALTLVGWGLTRHQQSASLARDVKQLETEARASKQTEMELKKLHDERRSLIYQADIQEQLDQPIAPTTVLALVGRLMPESIDLSRIKITTHRPAPKPLVADDQKSKHKTRQKKMTKADQEAQRDYMIVDVYGMAPDDVAVGAFVESLNADPVLENVKLNYSRAEENDRVAMRRFYLSAEVPLDRRYVPQPQTAGVTDED